MSDQPVIRKFEDTRRQSHNVFHNRRNSVDAQEARSTDSKGLLSTHSDSSSGCFVDVSLVLSKYGLTFV